MNKSEAYSEIAKMSAEIIAHLKGEKKTAKIKRTMETLGFVEIVGKRGGHFHYTHKILRGAKVTVGCSPSDANWCYGFMKHFKRSAYVAQGLQAA